MTAFQLRIIIEGCLKVDFDLQHELMTSSSRQRIKKIKKKIKMKDNKPNNTIVLKVYAIDCGGLVSDPKTIKIIID